MRGLGDLLVESRLDAWRDWLTWQVVHGYAPFLSSPFVNENFDFYGRTLTATEALRERWKRGVAFVEGAMGEAVGKIYVVSATSPRRPRSAWTASWRTSSRPIASRSPAWSG